MMEKIRHPAATFPLRTNGATFVRVRGIAGDAAAALPCAAQPTESEVTP